MTARALVLLAAGAGALVPAPLGFSFSVSGLLFPYHIGVADRLRESGLLSDATPLQGASGGALAACVAAANLPVADALEASIEIAERCNAKGGGFWNLGPVLRAVLDGSVGCDIIGAETHRVLTDRASPANVSYTAIGASPFLNKRTAAHFSSRQDLVDVLCASCHIPLYSGLNPVVSVRGELALDGFYSGPASNLGMQPTSAVRTVRISPFRKYHQDGLDVIPQSTESLGADQAELVQWALGFPKAPTRPQQLKLFQAGRDAAEQWEQLTASGTVFADADALLLT
ncbi:hypothetical protein M885DRAFT_521793 [Pelagophyceae sp. CCMP2097]|nr:hypothetical protein M885DRAFT_521793 [Pelagophyceae sp. CCMP2097]|mmetsp:Transcript_31672/g.106689  ORF Transcript_31672/g.106689 Transcript_31672/m.106689 type:complete len:286 (+) Transcript_31672:17-874(+)